MRLPRNQGAAEQLKKEHFWLQKISPLLPISIPQPISQGHPTKDYPFDWSVYKWIEGDIFNINTFQDSNPALLSMVQFISALQRINTTDAPLPNKQNNFRGVHLTIRDAQTREAIKQVAHIYDKNLINKIWDVALNAPVWSSSPVWIHGDLHWGNILTRERQIVGIIDFGCLGVGDPANDIMSAWILFSPEIRKEFKKSIGIDDATWTRGCGWALSWAAVALPYYLPKRHLLADIATYTINNILYDYRTNCL
jgi:aminoglycoside phosphotransferase (APT) family kinase protein